MRLRRPKEFAPPASASPAAAAMPASASRPSLMLHDIVRVLMDVQGIAIAGARPLVITH